MRQTGTWGTRTLRESSLVAVWGLLVGTSVILTRVVDERDKVVMTEGEDGPRRGSLAVTLRYVGYEGAQ
jgi:hypothetical protein